VKLAADLLLQVHGRRALGIAKSRSREPSLTTEEREQALAVRREIERRLGVSTQRDIGHSVS
jgi:pantothenate synthetase